MKPATALGEREERGEHDPGTEAEDPEDERDRDVGIDAKHPTRDGAHSGARCPPEEAHPDCTAHASQPLPHDLLRPLAPRLCSLRLQSPDKTLCVAKYNSEEPDSRARIAV